MNGDKLETPSENQLGSKIHYPRILVPVLGDSFFVTEGKIIDYKAYREVIPDAAEKAINFTSAGHNIIYEVFFQWIEIPTPDAKYSLIKDRIINKWRN